MRIVKLDFYCMETGVAYKKGDKYEGKRTDLEHLLEPVIKKATKEQDAKQKEMWSHSIEQDKKEKKERKPRRKKAEKK